ncbi:MAG: hypothetical protein CMF49_07525 [Legionellales bacterium]|nr:hypothetical protein [Legionellales bacterium]
MMKNFSIIIGTLLAASNLYAGNTGNQVQAPTGVSLQAPKSESAWSFGIEALYMKPSNATFQYVQISNQSTPTQTHQNNSVNPSSDWGGEFDATYHFAGNSRDIEVALMNLDVDNTGSTQIQDGQMSDPFGISNRFTDSANADMDNSVDAVDVVFGQTFKIGPVVTMRPFGGVRYADLESNNVAQYFNSQASAPAQGNGRINSEFVGFGPRAGLDASFHVSSRISVVGTVGASLLVGDIDTKLTTTAYQDNPQIIDNNESRASVPELDAKLGINYQQKLSANNSLDIQVGYQVVDYFDVINKDFIDASTINTVSNSDDLGFQGPYIRA